MNQNEEPTNGAPGDKGESAPDFDALIADLLNNGQVPREFAQSLLASLGAPSPFGFEKRFREPELLPKQEQRQAFTVRVDLENMKPPVWRRLRLASDLSLEEMHRVMQIAMGWTESHLHQFLMGPGTRDWDVAPFLTDFSESEGDEGIHEAHARLDQVLAKPGDRLYYEYDFGDGWQHTIKLESVADWDENHPRAWCLAGRRACPPENVGGPWSYAEVLDALDGKIAPENAEYMSEKLAWLPPDFDPALFSVDKVNAVLDSPLLSEVLKGWNLRVGTLLGRIFGPVSFTAEQLVRDALIDTGSLEEGVAAQAVRRFQVLLEVVGDGVKLTQAGWLPPAVVNDLAQRLVPDKEWIGRKNREDQTFPVAQLRQAALDVGLLRKAKGVLTVPAKVAKIKDSPDQLLAHIAQRLPAGRRDDEKDAGLLTLLAAAAGRPWRFPGGEVHDLFWASGWYIESDHELAFQQAAQATARVLSQLAGGHHQSLPTAVARRLLWDEGFWSRQLGGFDRASRTAQDRPGNE